MSIQVSYKKQVALGLMVLLVIIAVAEGIARTYEINFPRCDFLDQDAFNDTGYFLTRQICLDNLSLLTIQPEIFEPPIIFLKPDQHYPTININSHGFRGGEISQEKPENTYRIFFIGGSTAFGSGSTSDDATIPGFLQKKFNEANLGVNVEVINAGISAFESFSETYYVKNKLVEFEPDLFIVYDGANDAWVNYYEVDSNENYIEPKLVDYIPEEDVITGEEVLIRFPNLKFWRTPVVVYGYFLKSDVAPLNYSSTSLVPPELVPLWENRWNEICELGKRNGFDTLITIQPMLGVGNKPYSSAELTMMGDGSSFQTVNQNFQGMVDSLKELEKTCTKTADIRNSLENVTQTVYFDYAHLTDFGNEIIAQKIFDLALPLVNESLEGNILPNGNQLLQKISESNKR